LRFVPTDVPGAWILEQERHADERGFFARTWCARELAEHGLEPRLSQCSVSFNHRKGTLRGLHYQAPPCAEAKIVRCTRGAIFDVAVDLRPDSPTYRRWEGYELDDVDHLQLFIPDGFGHAFCVLSETADVLYRVSSYYDPELESGIAWDDPEIAIRWPITDPILSERDSSAPRLAEVAASLQR
jgi:dTDP-4-dehydrorhamnose 3,5-epimerase